MVRESQHHLFALAAQVAQDLLLVLVGLLGQNYQDRLVNLLDLAHLVFQVAQQGQADPLVQADLAALDFQQSPDRLEIQLVQDLL